MQKTKSLALLAVVFAGGAQANARFSTEITQPSGYHGLQFVQAQIAGVSESDMRRLVFYANRAARSLQSLVSGANERSIADQEKVNSRFRESITRLADAGARSGLSMDQVAGFFGQVVAETYGQGFMQQLGSFAGGLDLQTLFRNVSTGAHQNPNADAATGANYLNALDEASKGLDLGITTDNSNVSQGIQTLQTEPAGPAPLPNATAAEREIVSRIKVVNGRWELTVQRGDSLSAIASAIYGDALSYTTIYNANTSVIIDPNSIEVGIVLVLPRP